MKTTHRLKTHPLPFAAVLSGNKLAEYRRNDRDFKNGDELILEEFDPDTQSYTGRTLCKQVTHIQQGYGIPQEFAVLSIQ